MTTELFIALLAGDTVIAGVLSSVVTWLLSKKKYNTEVDNNIIANMQKSLEFYKTLADDYKKRLEEEIRGHNEEVAEVKKESAELRQENLELKKELREQEKKFDAMWAAQQKEISMMKNQMLSVYSQVCLNFNCMERVATRQLPTAPSKTKKTRTIKKDNNDGEKI